MAMIEVERDCVQCEELRLKKDLSIIHATQHSETRWQTPERDLGLGSDLPIKSRPI
jgi:hypothetical protein